MQVVKIEVINIRMDTFQQKMECVRKGLAAMLFSLEDSTIDWENIETMVEHFDNYSIKITL